MTEIPRTQVNWECRLCGTERAMLIYPDTRVGAIQGLIQEAHSQVNCKFDPAYITIEFVIDIKKIRDYVLGEVGE